MTDIEKWIQAGCYQKYRIPWGHFLEETDIIEVEDTRIQSKGVQPALRNKRSFFPPLTQGVTKDVCRHREAWWLGSGKQKYFTFDNYCLPLEVEAVSSTYRLSWRFGRFKRGEKVRVCSDTEKRMRLPSSVLGLALVDDHGCMMMPACQSVFKKKKKWRTKMAV